jgi:hypothetical protein
LDEEASQTWTDEVVCGTWKVEVGALNLVVGEEAWSLVVDEEASQTWMAEVGAPSLVVGEEASQT